MSATTATAAQAGSGQQQQELQLSLSRVKSMYCTTDCVYLYDETICFAHACERMWEYVREWAVLAFVGGGDGGGWLAVRLLTRSLFEQIACSFIKYKNHTQICFQCVSFGGYCGARDTSRLFPYGSLWQTVNRRTVCRVSVYRKHIQAYVICKCYFLLFNIS